MRVAGLVRIADCVTDVTRGTRSAQGGRPLHVRRLAKLAMPRARGRQSPPLVGAQLAAMISWLGLLKWWEMNG